MKDELTKTMVSILAFFIIFSITPLAKAEISEEEVFENVDVELSGYGAIRVGNITLAHVTIINANYNVPVMIENITIFNSKNELVFLEEVNFVAQPVGKEKEALDAILRMRAKIGINNPLIVPYMIFSSLIYKRASLKIKEHEFEEFYHLDLNKFHPVLGEDIITNLQVTLRYDDKIMIKEVNYSTEIAPRRPGPAPGTSLSDKARTGRAEREKTTEEKKELAKGWQGG